MRTTVILLLIAGFVALPASSKVFSDDNSSGDADEKSAVNLFRDELETLCSELESTSSEEKEEGSEQYFFGKLFKRVKGAADGDRNSTGRGRGRGRGRGSRRFDGEGEGRNSSKGPDFFRKFFGKKQGAGNSSSDVDGASKKEALIRKILAKKVGSGSGDASNGGDFLKKYLKDKAASYSGDKEELVDDMVSLEILCAQIFAKNKE